MHRVGNQKGSDPNRLDTGVDALLPPVDSRCLLCNGGCTMVIQWWIMVVQWWDLHRVMLGGHVLVALTCRSTRADVVGAYSQTIGRSSWGLMQGTMGLGIIAILFMAPQIGTSPVGCCMHSGHTPPLNTEEVVQSANGNSRGATRVCLADGARLRCLQSPDGKRGWPG